MALVPLLIRVITLGIQPGVLTGNNVRKLFDYAKENKVSGLQLHGGYICGTDGDDPLLLQSWYRLLHYAILISQTGLVIFF